MKCFMSSNISHYSDYQPSQCHVHSICKADKKDCKCCIAFLLWADGFYYLDHTTTNLTHTGHPQFTPEAKLKGIRYSTNQSKLLIECMSAVGVCPSQLTTLLEILDDSDSTYQSATVKKSLQKCELL